MAVNPPPNKSAMATNPSIKAQKIRCPTGASNFPPEVILSITKEPLSEEVTKTNFLYFQADYKLKGLNENQDSGNQDGDPLNAQQQDGG